MKGVDMLSYLLHHTKTLACTCNIITADTMFSACSLLHRVFCVYLAGRSTELILQLLVYYLFIAIPTSF